MKIISGKQNYVFAKTREWAKYGYRAVKQTNWADGTITIRMEKV